MTTYKLPDTIKEIFKQGENQYRMIDYSPEMEMDNNQSIRIDKLQNGYIKLYGVENATEINEIIKESELKKRALEIYEKHNGEDGYYNFTKFLWVLYPDGNDIRLDEIVHYP